MRLRSSISALIVAASMSESVLARAGSFDLVAQPLSDALRNLGAQAEINVLYEPEYVQGHKAPEIVGANDLNDVLTRLLKGTGLTYRYVNSHTVTLVRTSSNSGSAEDEKTDPLGQRLSAAPAIGGASSVSEGAVRDKASSVSENTAEDDSPSGVQNLESVIVTGTYIRGVSQPAGAHVLTIDRAAIEKSGYSTLQDVVRSLPQNVRGNVREDTSLNANDREALTNSSNDAGVNLRGLGAGSTLILLNGRRLAPGGTSGAFTGVSSIPLTAVERIEVLPDGASALYGSDAVGGVVNIITRKDFSGFDTSARYGSVTQGDSSEIQLGQALGTRWDGGNGLLSMEYYRRGALAANSRSQTNSDLTANGGSNFNINQCNPGTILAGGSTFALPSGQAGTNLSSSNLVPATENLCNRNEGDDLYGRQRKWNVLGTIEQHFSDVFSLATDAMIGRRKVTNRDGQSLRTLEVPSSNAFYFNPSGGSDPVFVQYNLVDDLGRNVAQTTVDSMNFGVKATAKIGGNWEISPYVGYSSEKQDQRQVSDVDDTLLNAALADSNPQTAFNPFGDGSNTSIATLAALRGSRQTFFESTSTLRLANITADGPLFTLPGGEAKLAAGVDYRDQSFGSSITQLVRSEDEPVFNQSASSSRQVTAAFAELYVPIVGPINERRGIRRLEFSAAGRYEHYDDFGSAAVPRFGALWAPIRNLGIRGSWSKSYKAPNLPDLIEENNFSYITSYPDPTVDSGASNVLFWGSNNRDLKEETATIWTLGADYGAANRAGLKLSATYFDINYSNRIANLPNTNYLGDPSNAPGVIRNPSAEQRELACTQANFLGNFSDSVGDCLSSTVAALIDLRLRNLSTTKEGGIDVQGGYEWDSMFGKLGLNLGATYIFQYSQAVTATANTIDLVNTPANPIDLKLRGEINWIKNSYSASIYVNYVDGYTDPLSVPARNISSWTTVDLNVAFSPRASAGLFEDVQFSIAAQNLFDRDPPFYNNAEGVGYDPANADLLKRFLSLNVRKVWR